MYRQHDSHGYKPAGLSTKAPLPDTGVSLSVDWVKFPANIRLFGIDNWSFQWYCKLLFMCFASFSLAAVVTT
jgi:hypothetical protein